MENIEEKLKKYVEQNKKKCFALRDWLILKGNIYKFKEALIAVYEAANGNFNTMNDIIEHLTEKRKVYGRTQVYAENNTPLMGLRRDENGKLIVYGYRDNMPLNPKGQHRPTNNKIFRKTDDKVSKTYQNSEKKMYDLGAQVREMFPEGSNHDITFIMQAIKKYADKRKVSTDKVILSMKKGRLEYNDELDRLVPVVRENTQRRTILIREDVANEIASEMNMTEYKFNSNIKQFLHDLLVDPSNAKVPFILKQYGYNRKRLIYFLSHFDILRKTERISDKGDDGQPKTATMMVKFQVPKKNFDRKLHKLYIRLFEDNTNQKQEELTEDGEACGATTCDASSGQFSQPVFPMQRRTFNEEMNIEEDTTCGSVGDYQYDVPFTVDDETLKRNNGYGGSNSVNFAE